LLCCPELLSLGPELECLRQAGPGHHPMMMTVTRDKVFSKNYDKSYRKKEYRGKALQVVC
jgi:hypothetical protein